MHIVGTAGHVDHGKSALIAALTGTNPDRLIEEQVRGMTLDLGFAHLRFDDGVEAGIVDVPGHERFLHNMLAGAAGMEIVLLVVDANEGVMPQTIEHLQILQFLNVRTVIVVATKIDLTGESERAAAIEAIRERLRGTIAAGAPVYCVSSTTRENLDELLAALHDRLAALPPRAASAPIYLPVDRVFTLPGLGTVVTGTLMQGSITAGESLAIEPGGVAAHVRSIGVFGTTVQRVEAGSRVALNVPGVDRRQVRRGQAVVGPEFCARRSFRVRFVPLQNAVGMLRRRTPVRAYVGAAEVLGTLVLDDAATPAEIRAELHLREEIVAFPGLRFVLRRPSPMTLLGGGHVEGVDVATPEEGADASEKAVLGVLRERAPSPVELSAIAAGANLRESAAHGVLARLMEQGEVIRVTRPPAYADAGETEKLLAGIVTTLEDAHRKEPWAMGMTSIALSRALGVAEATLVRIAEHYADEGRLLKRGGYFAAPAHRPSLTNEQEAFFEYLTPVDDTHPLLPVPFPGAAAAVKLSHVGGVSKAFDTMLAQGALVKVGDDLYRGTQIAQIRARVEAHFEQYDRMTAAQFRDLLGTSRKYAVPLLEWLDTHGITIRNGDYRTLRRAPNAAGA